ncbi:MAG TPA: neutral/alkaline non-lysosomal ceramidase N-terminal domain-containing protein, partial [Acidimicrobiales bacterium]|nr:neutral/alkaline non-lysosomal ceramidase N-terminal domain-containing protein [Acidimicrobiales bacterium]
SRLTMRALVVEQDGRRVALVKSDHYLAQDLLVRRVGQLLAEAGSSVTADDILHSATHNHSSPYYATPSWGVWLFQDVMDLRAFEHQARAMRDAILAAEADLQPARMGATTVEHTAFKSNIAGRGNAEDGTPFGYPEDFGDTGLTVLRFDALDGTPIAVWASFGQHPESLDAMDLISADFLGPLERFVDREVGAPLVFSQGDVGSAEGPYYRDENDRLPDGTVRAWAHVGHAQMERGARLLADSVLDGWRRIGTGDVEVPLTSDAPVSMATEWVPGPVSHPYPSISNCRTEQTVEGNPGVPVAGLPDCERVAETDPGLAEWESLKQHGFPIPDHYDAPAFTGVEENLRLKLQVVRIGDVLLASCACEAQVDLILNLESRANDVAGDIWDGFPWDAHCDDDVDGTWRCPDATKGVDDRSVTVSDAAYQRMKAQIHNDAAGWDEPANALAANSEPADPTRIWGNFTKEELSPEDGFAVVVGLGHTGDYNGYTVSYREYMARDHYRKALTSYGPHTADHMVTHLVRLAAGLRTDDELEPVAQVDELRQQAVATALGLAAGTAYDAWRSSLPDDAGAPEVLAQPSSIERFAATTVTWRGGSNAVDNPTVRVERRLGDAWTPFADQSGEVQTTVDLPDGVQGIADTYTGAQEWRWTASFEAFDGFPARLGQTPTGTYRFVVDGVHRTGGADTEYHLESTPFEVRPWDGITVSDLQVDRRGHVSFVVDPIRYPRTYESAFAVVGDDGDTTLCRTCSFRPWATTGEAASATVAVLDGDVVRRTVTASLVDGRWVARTKLRQDERAVLAPGAVVDGWGETNGDTWSIGRDGVVDVVVSAETTEPVDVVVERTETTPLLPISSTSAAASAALALALVALVALALRRSS